MVFKVGLKCEICGRESSDWREFVFRRECDWEKKELRNFGVRCRNEKYFPRLSENGAIESWHHAPHFLVPGNLMGFFVYLLALLDAGFRLDGKYALVRFLESCLSETAGGKGVSEIVDASA